MCSDLARLPLAVVLTLLAVSAADAAEPAWDLKEADRVVFLGSTQSERAQSYGYLEARLTARWPDHRLVFRNLAWSGDNVWGHARSGFDPPQAGYAKLLEQVKAARPTVLVIAYGATECFAGPDGLPKFVNGLNRLLDDVGSLAARVVLVTPAPFENLPPPLPDHTEHNRWLADYAQAIRSAATARGYTLVDLHALRSASPAQAFWTDNGLHFTAAGHWLAAQQMAGPSPQWRVKIDAGAATHTAAGTKLTQLQIAEDRMSFTLRDDTLPECPPPADSGLTLHSGRLLQIAGLPEGRYELCINGMPVAIGTHGEWARGVELVRGPELEQAEALRQAIVEKNRLFFYRWRPQNETYLFGFRKHEQGQNAAEIPKFDPLVAQKEALIYKLAAPREHKYELRKH